MTHVDLQIELRPEDPAVEVHQERDNLLRRGGDQELRLSKHQAARLIVPCLRHLDGIAALHRLSLARALSKVVEQFLGISEEVDLVIAV